MRLFIAYAHEDRKYKKKLDKFLVTLKNNGFLTSWSDQQIIPGSNWETDLRMHLETADITLLLISQDFISSQYCYHEEMKLALERCKKGETFIIPVIIRHCMWEDTPLYELEALPKNKIPVSAWRNMDEAYKNITEGIATTVKAILESRRETPENSNTENQSGIGDKATEKADDGRKAKPKGIFKRIAEIVAGICIVVVIVTLLYSALNNKPDLPGPVFDSEVPDASVLASPASTSANNPVSSKPPAIESTNVSSETDREGRQFDDSGGNAMNGGTVIHNGGLIYFSDPMNGHRLFRMSEDFTGKTALNDDKTSNINLVGNRIYYIGTDDLNIYRVDGSGTGKEKLNKDKSLCLIIAGEFMLYIDLSDNKKLCRMKTDGSEKTVLNEFSCQDIFPCGDWLYFVQYSPYFDDADGIYRIKADSADGKDKELIVSGFCNAYAVDKEYVYYTNNNDQNSIYRKKLDGSEIKELTEDSTLSMNISNGWLYYSNDSDNCFLYRIDINGENRTRLNTDNSSDINIAGGWVYYSKYYNESGGFGMFRIKPDGSAITEIAQQY